jgi:hypothetical protein
MFWNIFKRKKTYIKYENRNSQWNDGHGHVLVYVKDELKEHIFVDDYREKYEDIENDVFIDAYSIIDEI